MKNYLPFIQYSPDLGIRQTGIDGQFLIGGIPILKNLVPQNNTFRPFYGITDYTDTSVDQDIILIKGFYASQTSNKVFLFTKNEIYRVTSQTPGEITHDPGGASYFTTDNYDNWDVDIYGDTLYMTNNERQMVKMADFTTDTTCTTVSEAPLTCKSLQLFENHLFTFNQGTNALRLRRSAQGDPDDFTVDPDTGAGYSDLPSYGEFGVAIRRLGDTLVAYCSNSIYFVRYIGPPFWFQYEKVSENVGLLSMHAVVSIDRYRHLFISSKRDALYFTTQNGIQRLDSNIEKAHLSNIADNPNRITTSIDYFNNIVYFALPTANKEPDRLLAYNYKDNRFSVIDPSYGETFAGYTITAIGNVLVPDIVINDMGDYFPTINSIPNEITINSVFWLGGEEKNSIAVTDGTDRDIKLIDSGEVMDSVISTSEFETDSDIIITDAIVKFDGVELPYSMRLLIYYKYNDSDSFKVKAVSSNKYNEFKFMVTGRFFRFQIETSFKFDAIEGIKYEFEARGGL